MGASYPGLRITGLETFLVEGNCCFVKIHTNEGITGLGEGSISDNKAGTIAQCIRDFEGHLIGKNPTDIEYLWQGLYRWNRWHVGVLFSTALSAIDIALWDILGKVAGLPIYKLLGGRRGRRSASTPPAAAARGCSAPAAWGATPSRRGRPSPRSTTPSPCPCPGT